MNSKKRGPLYISGLSSLSKGLRGIDNGHPCRAMLFGAARRSVIRPRGVLMKKYIKCAAAVVLLVLIAAPAIAEESKTYVALKAGGGSIQVNSEQAINGVTEEQDIFSGGVFAGYNFDSGMVVEAGLSGEFSEDFFESYD